MKKGLYIVVLLILALSACSVDSNKKGDTGAEVKTPRQVHKIIYGIVIDSLSVDTGVIKKNEFLSDILLKHGVDYGTIDKLVRTSKKVFDVRKIKRGNRYIFISQNDSVKKPLYFVYEINRSDYVLYHLTDSIYVEKGKKNIEYKEKAFKGTIKSSLWNAVRDAGVEGYMANKLSDVYAWTIDFFALKKGDKFKVIYDKVYIDGKPVASGKIKASLFRHQGHDYYAFYFVQNGEGDYFDEEGNSLERTFLKAPLKYSRISSRFTESRYHPVLKIRRPHHGVDYAAPEGTPVHSVGDGVIIKKGYQRRGGGNYLKIKHNGTYTTSYMHLRAFAKGMKVGKHVKQGELIGYVGHTGLATGPHLDFRFYIHGRPVDPLKVKSPPAKPVDKKNRPEFDSLVRSYMQVLDTIRF